MSQNSLNFNIVKFRTTQQNELLYDCIIYIYGFKIKAIFILRHPLYLNYFMYLSLQFT